MSLNYVKQTRLKYLLHYFYVNLFNLDKNLIKTKKAEKELKEGVSGFIVDFPLEFLSKEPNFLPELTTAEGIMPKDLWI